MKELVDYINQLGWFSGTARLEIKVENSFEGFYGRASETWEQQYTIKTNEIKNSDGQIILPCIELKSMRYESADEFAGRFLRLIKED